jgi:hypothetical protein
MKRPILLPIIQMAVLSAAISAAAGLAFAGLLRNSSPGDLWPWGVAVAIDALGIGIGIYFSHWC